MDLGVPLPGSCCLRFGHRGSPLPVTCRALPPPQSGVSWHWFGMDARKPPSQVLGADVCPLTRPRLLLLPVGAHSGMKAVRSSHVHSQAVAPGCFRASARAHYRLLLWGLAALVEQPTERVDRTGLHNGAEPHGPGRLAHRSRRRRLARRRRGTIQGSRESWLDDRRLPWTKGCFWPGSME